MDIGASPNLGSTMNKALVGGRPKILSLLSSKKHKDPDTGLLTLTVQVPNYKVCTQDHAVTIPSIKALHTLFLGTWDPWDYQGIRSQQQWWTLIMVFEP